MYIWKRALIIIADNPIFGVGVGCFPEAIGELRGQLKEQPKWQVTHNSFLQVASEMGLIAFIIFMMLIYRTYKSLKTVNDVVKVPNVHEKTDYLASCLNIGFVSMLVCSFFLSQAYSHIFSMYFAFGEIVSSMNNNSMHVQEALAKSA